MSRRCKRLLDARGKSFLRKSAWLLIVLLAISSPATACTSFAVYSDMPWYGMNFDCYSTTPFLVSIVQENGRGLFFMAYLWGNRYVPTVGINEAGLFASTQLHHNETIVDIDAGDDSLYMYQLFADSLVSLDRVSQVREIAATRRVVDAYPYRPTHNLFADPTGQAIVVETIATNRHITRPNLESRSV
jgi:penicillin V acylase-like amidase (Ntn superfamily)